ncbi:glycosyltransferase family 2 protein [Nodularia spumigena CS-584]|uniref:glycosyltransferase n=1 Tax=Nodularia spumigena TaxID=70799 RepID=UPI00037302F9|nr:glycosyltransferase family 2 protein [Nodularia spumigena CS-584]
MQFFTNKPSKSLDLLEFEHYLNFLNKIKLPSKVVAVIKVEAHTSDDMLGWHGLTSLTCLSETNEIYDIDVRYAWSNILFKQNLVDHGWNETILLENKVRGMPYRHKLIIYLCNISIRIDQPVRIEKVEENLFIGCYWQSILHLYIQMPFEHPFEHQLHEDEHNDFQESLLFDYAPVIINNKNAQINTTPLLAAHPQRKGEGGLRKLGLYKHSVNQKPLISIITVVFNGEKYIEQTIQSVINQSYKNIEYIIIDGGSTDKTLDIIKQYEEYIDYWVSEPDQGIYDAMNKGIKASTGELIGLINSGDVYTNNAIKQVVELYTLNKPNHEHIIITGAMYRFNDEGSFLFKLVKKYEDLNTRINKGMPINHPSTFVSINTYKTLDYFDPKFRICGDYDFIFRAYHSSIVKFIFTNTDIAYMRLGGVSEKFKSLWTRCIEHFLIRKSNIFWVNNFLMSTRWLSIAVSKFLLKKILGNKLMSIYYRVRHKSIKHSII